MNFVHSVSIEDQWQVAAPLGRELMFEQGCCREYPHHD